MAKFILIDHSLRSVGGHHFEYAAGTLQEAEQAGFEVVLATHRDFQQHELPDSWQVCPLFQYDVYNKYAIPWNKNHQPRTPTDTATSSTSERPVAAKWYGRLRDKWISLDRRRRLASFRSACERLFKRVRLKSGDIVFAATLSSFDFEGLTSYLAGAPESNGATWHVQFHHDIMQGREADYDRQPETLRSMQTLFSGALARIPDHRVVFHTTTHSLAVEFSYLKEGAFQELPYPVSTEFHQEPATNQPPKPTTLNVTCAGGMRREKGSHEMHQLIDQLWDPYLVKRNVRLRVQASKKRFEKLCRATPMTRDSQALEHISHPLQMNEYVRLIQTTDIGLFLYDSWSYYARCSGILVEMLAAGVPVIVPAACWLAKQIEEPIYHYVDRVQQANPTILQRAGEDIDWNGAGVGCLPSFNDVKQLVAKLEVPAEATAFVLRFGFAPETTSYTRVKLVQRSINQERLATSTNVLGPRRNRSLPVSVLVPLKKDTRHVEIVVGERV